VQFELALERLMALPDPLPAPAEVLTPVVVDVTGAGVLPGRPVRPVGAAGGRAAGVLVLLYPDDDGATRVVLAVRAARRSPPVVAQNLDFGSFHPSEIVPLDWNCRECRLLGGVVLARPLACRARSGRLAVGTAVRAA